MLKIPHSIRQYYNTLYDKYENLKIVVEDIVKESALLDQGWLFVGRIKSVESFYFKLQTGRIDASHEDFLGFTIVVENLTKICELESRIEKLFSVKYRRPKRNDFTLNNPENFAFEYIRLYLTVRDNDRFGQLHELVFEIQIKTYLQHAWTIATHDLIYKPTDGGDWALARVAFQIKAMLEHAEVSIAQAEDIAKADALKKQTEKIVRTKTIKERIIERWPEGMGHHTMRVAENIIRILDILKIEESKLFEWIDCDTNIGKGCKQTSYSPYEVALDAILNHAKVENLLPKISDKKKIFVPCEFLEEHPEIKEVFTTV